MRFFLQGDGNSTKDADASFQLFHKTVVNRRATQGAPPDTLDAVVLRSQVNAGRRDRAPTGELNLVSTERDKPAFEGMRASVSNRIGPPGQQALQRRVLLQRGKRPVLAVLS